MIRKSVNLSVSFVVAKYERLLPLRKACDQLWHMSIKETPEFKFILSNVSQTYNMFCKGYWAVALIENVRFVCPRNSATSDILGSVAETATILMQEEIDCGFVSG